MEPPAIESGRGAETHRAFDSRSTPHLHPVRLSRLLDWQHTLGTATTPSTDGVASSDAWTNGRAPARHHSWRLHLFYDRKDSTGLYVQSSIPNSTSRRRTRSRDDPRVHGRPKGRIGHQPATLGSPPLPDSKSRVSRIVLVLLTLRTCERAIYPVQSSPGRGT